MAQLIQIGSSRGVRIPKYIIEKAELEGRMLDFCITPDGVLLKPVRNVREGWEEAFNEMHRNGDDKLLWPEDMVDDFDKDWTW